MSKALRRVKSNKGSPSIEGMRVWQLPGYLEEHWQGVRDQLVRGTYKAQPVNRVEIAKPDGGVRKLGIPTVLDRFIQQALLQVLQKYWDCTFSEHRFGFRPKRSAHQAVACAQQHLAGGYCWIVDIDLEKFFDRLNHDMLMGRVAKRVRDRRVLRLIRTFLNAGVMENGLVSPITKGTPQGGPLSPLLSNIVLDDLDRELERRGHRFVRYADDCNVYVRSQRAGQRVMASVERFLWKRLRINRDKSAVDRFWKRKFLGYSVTWHRKPKLKVAPESVKRLKAKLRVLFRRGRGRNLARVCEELSIVLRSWVAYFRLCEVKASFEVLDGWIRRKLRAIIWRQWRRPPTRLKELVKRGLAPTRAATSAYNGRGPWWNARASHMNQAVRTSSFRQMGLVSLIDEHRRLVCFS